MPAGTRLADAVGRRSRAYRPVLLTMLDEDGTPFDVEPRNVLNRVWQALRQRGLFPVAAVELEFYLIDRQRDAEGDLQPPCAPGTRERNTQSRCIPSIT